MIKMIRKLGRKPALWILSGLIIIIALAAFGFVLSSKLEPANNEKGATRSSNTVARDVEARLSSIMEKGPQASSNPYDYIKNNKDFSELAAMGDSALDYMVASFEKSNSDGLREYIMACACAKIMGNYDEENGIGTSSGREWFYKYAKFEKDNTFLVVDADYDEYKSGSSHKEGKVYLPDNTDKRDMNDVIAKYILARNRTAYWSSEKAIESHKIYRTEKDGDVLNVYMQMTFGWFGFENGVFTVVSGCGAIPLKMQLEKTGAGEYNVLEYREPEDGGRWAESIREMFPKDLAELFSKSDPKTGTELWQSQVRQAKEYLKKIGREDAAVKNHVDKNISDAHQAIYYVTQMKREFPDWNGSKEVLVRTGGPAPGTDVRCILATKCTGDGEGNYTVTLTKDWGLTFNGSPVKSLWKYRVAGENVKLLESQDQDDKIRMIK